VLNGVAMTLGRCPSWQQRFSVRQHSIDRWREYGGHLYKVLTPGINDVMYVRYYVKYTTTIPHHSGIWVGGSNPPSAWPDPQAGSNRSATIGSSQAPSRTTWPGGSSTTTTGWDASGPDGLVLGDFLINNPNLQVVLASGRASGNGQAQQSSFGV